MSSKFVTFDAGGLAQNQRGRPRHSKSSTHRLQPFNHPRCVGAHYLEALGPRGFAYGLMCDGYSADYIVERIENERRRWREM